jgi:signal transduction histidine kinase
MKEVDIHEGIESTLLILEHRLKKTGSSPGISIIKNYGKLPPVECYAGQLNQVFMNILTNAIDALEMETNHLKYPKQTPVIIITTACKKGEIFINIKDNGPGMTEEVKHRLFDPFFTTKPVGAGTGLGMSISYQIIEKHNGQLECISSPGKGAEFSIKVPVKNLRKPH